MRAAANITTKPTPKRISWRDAQGSMEPLAAEYSMAMPKAVTRHSSSTRPQFSCQTF